MIFEATSIPGAFVVSLQRHEDERGFFARLWCEEEFTAAGIEVRMAQASMSHTRVVGTLRGMHFSRAPAREGKLVRCMRGRIFDVILDLRPASPSYLRYFSIELDDLRGRSLYVPPGVAHGFQTLEDYCDVLYMMTEAYRAELADGVRHDDPAFRIRWPRPVSLMAERDRQYPDYRPARAR